jgi:hypothetical protein
VRPRVSYANVVSTLALVLALGGSAVAAKQTFFNGKNIKPRSIPANRIKKHSLTGTEIDVRKLGSIPRALSAGHATTADSALNSTHATNADNALNATQAATSTTANDARQLGGLAPSAFQSRIRWALIREDGTIVSQSGGITSTHQSTGVYVFGLGEPVGAKSLLATPDPSFTSTARIDISAAPCGTNANAGEVDCGAGFNDGQHVFAEAADSFASTAGNQDEGFYINFIG